MSAAESPVASLGLVVTGLPHPLLVPERNPGWGRVRAAFDRAAELVRQSDADVLLVYSTLWPSVIGHQIVTDPTPEWVHVDELFHDLGSIPYRFRVDAELGAAMCQAARDRGLAARTVAYHGFPIDTGSVVALKLLTPDNELPACIVSSNVYADRAETVVLGKAAADALRAQGKKAVAVAVTSLSNRLFTEVIAPGDDRIHSQKDDEWNRKLLEFLGEGRLEDVAQLSREIHKQIRVKKVVSFKAMWWLSAVMGQHNHYDGEVLAYEPIYGTGATVTALRPAAGSVGDKEFDEEDVEHFQGDRNVLERALGEAAPGLRDADDEDGDEAMAARPPPRTAAAATPPSAARPAATAAERIEAADAPRPVGAYPHARKVGDLLYLSGVGPRQAGTDAIPGGPVRDAAGKPLDYDAAAQTHAVVDNVARILAAAGSSLEQVVDVTTFLIDMDRDFAPYNQAYKERLGAIGPTRTTVAVRALPTPIAVEMKVIARAGKPGGSAA